jgi:hypothetical protein
MPRVRTHTRDLTRRDWHSGPCEIADRKPTKKGETPWANQSKAGIRINTATLADKK